MSTTNDWQQRAEFEYDRAEQAIANSTALARKLQAAERKLAKLEKLKNSRRFEAAKAIIQGEFASQGESGHYIQDEANAKTLIARALFFSDALLAELEKDRPAQVPASVVEALSSLVKRTDCYVVCGEDGEGEHPHALLNHIARQALRDLGVEVSA